MKKTLFIFLAVSVVSGISQNPDRKPAPNGIINAKLITQTKFSDKITGELKSAGPKATPAETQISNSPAKSSIQNTWNNFTSSMNIYGSLISFCKPLQWNDELNVISFIHRKSPTYTVSPVPAPNAENGSIVAMISKDCGTTWDSTAIWANDNSWGRYPGGAVYNPPVIPTNTNINNAFIVGAGPVTDAGSVPWIGNWYASKQLNIFDNVPSTVPNAQQVTSSYGPYAPNLGRHDFSAYGFTATDDGKMRVLAGVTDDALASDTAVTLITGTFNQMTQTFDWTGHVFNPPTVMASDGSEQWLSRPMMAWNETGTVGYVVIIGANTNGIGSNVGFQPIVYKTINSGASWSLENGIDFNSSAFNDVKRSIISVSTNTTLQVPFFNWLEGMDCAVDANNKLHVFSTVVGAVSDHPDSTAFIGSFDSEQYKWPHTPGFRPYLYDFIYDGTNVNPTWSHLLVDSMSTESADDTPAGAGYNDNLWNMDPTNNNTKVREDARLQMSRTPDGNFIVYTWAESDTNYTTAQRKWNTLPDVKARVLNVTTGQIIQTGPSFGEIHVTATAPGDVVGRAMFHFVSPKCRLASTNLVNGPVLSVPMTVSNSNPYSQLTPNKHWFSWAFLNFGNVPDNNIVTCGPLFVPPPPPPPPPPPIDTGINDNELAGVQGSYIFPNPTKNNVTLTINLVNSVKVEIKILNAIGQEIKSINNDGQPGSNSVAIDLKGLSSGIYFVNVKTRGKSSTKKLVVE
jgi:hypothetical protein